MGIINIVYWLISIGEGKISKTCVAFIGLIANSPTLCNQFFNQYLLTYLARLVEGPKFIWAAFLSLKLYKLISINHFTPDEGSHATNVGRIPIHTRQLKRQVDLLIRIFPISKSFSSLTFIVSHEKNPSMIYGPSAQNRGDLIQFNLQRC